MKLCNCGSIMALKAKTCAVCKDRAMYQRRKLQKQGLLQRRGYDKEIESDDRVNRLLAAVDAMKRRQRWAA